MHVKAKANRERPVKVTVLKELVHVRFRDGEALLKTGEQQRRIGAIYVAGYGIECALKARLCDDRRVRRLPAEFRHHNLRKLAERTALWPAIEGDPRRRSLLTFLVSEWEVSMRYAMRPYEEPQVRSFLERAREFAKWLSEN